MPEDERPPASGHLSGWRPTPVRTSGRPSPPWPRASSRWRAGCRGAPTSPFWCRWAARGTPGRLQAAAGRAATVGLPRRPLPPGGRRLRPLGGAGLGAGSSDGGPGRRAVRRRLAAAASWRPTTSSTTSPWSRTGRAGSSTACGTDVRLRRGGQQRRPQERSRAPGRRRPPLGHRPRALLPPHPKLRTVIWEFAGDEVPAADLATVGGAGRRPPRPGGPPPHPRGAPESGRPGRPELVGDRDPALPGQRPALSLAPGLTDRPGSPAPAAGPAPGGVSPAG